MRDIRADLRERIDAEKAKREPLLRSLERIDSAIDALAKLLALEEGREFSRNPQLPMLASEDGPRPFTLASDDAPPMQVFLLETLQGGPKTLDELRDAAIAAGYFSAGMPGSPGRKVHGALLNPMQAGQVEKDMRGRYFVPENRMKLPRSVQPGRITEKET